MKQIPDILHSGGALNLLQQRYHLLEMIMVICSKSCADLVDLYSVRVLQEEEFAFPSGYTGNGVEHFIMSSRLSWDLWKKKKLNMHLTF